MKFDISKVTTLPGKAGLSLQKHSPEILLVAGIGGIIFSTVKACQATTKAEAVLEEFKKQKEECKSVATDPELEESREKTGYDIVAYRKEMAGIYAKTSLKMARVYALPLAVGTISIACILGSHGILQKRVAGLTAAYTAVDSAFKSYRQRVVERFGEEVDKDLKIGRKTEEIVVGTKTDKDGKTKDVKEKVTTLDGTDDPSEYGRWFDEQHSREYKANDDIYNLAYLKGQETYFNNLLTARGHVFLNEVYDALGFERTPAGAVVGWIKGNGDGFIDFQIVENSYRKSNEYNVNDDSKLAFTKNNGFFLDFNVDGVIWNKI